MHESRDLYWNADCQPLPSPVADDWWWTGEGRGTFITWPPVSQKSIANGWHEANILANGALSSMHCLRTPSCICRRAPSGCWFAGLLGWNFQLKEKVPRCSSTVMKTGTRTLKFFWTSYAILLAPPRLTQRANVRTEAKEVDCRCYFIYYFVDKKIRYFFYIDGWKTAKSSHVCSLLEMTMHQKWWLRWLHAKYRGAHFKNGNPTSAIEL